MTSTAAGALELLSRELRRMSAAEYHRMIEAGVLDEDEHVELLEGVIVRRSPQNAPHALVLERLNDPRFVRLPGEFLIRCQSPLAVSENSEPEPDIAVVERGPRSWERQPATARLIFEVAGESLRKDREIKAPLYATAAVPEYVIVNMKDQCLEVHRDPDPAAGRYRALTRLGKGEAFASTAVPGLGFSVADLLA